MVSPIHYIGFSCPDGGKDICLCFKSERSDPWRRLDVRDKTLDVTTDGRPELDPADVISLEALLESERHYREKARQTAKAAAKARWSSRTTILAKIKGYFEDERQREGAIEITRNHFDKTRGSQVRHGDPAIFYEDESGFAVEVEHGWDKPPSRTWFQVARKSGEIQELSYAEALKYGPRMLIC